ncbi:hypothetical protein KAI12_05730 [Candidatus Bathyarchaeota archaeon]|nr:hypothetical protein [Candidatus Bathyarchaeota archaeon]
MGVPKELCPKCGLDIGAVLYIAPLGPSESCCPNCGIKTQTKCRGCGSWLIAKERYCSKCGVINPIFFKK